MNRTSVCDIAAAAAAAAEQELATVVVASPDARPIHTIKHLYILYPTKRHRAPKQKKKRVENDDDDDDDDPNTQ